MFNGFLLLVACQLVGELARESLSLPVPGPVVGMFLLAIALGVRGHAGRDMERLADGLIGLMGIFFVPAGVGIITEAEVLRREWLPISVALVGSTCLALAVTGLVMHFTLAPHEQKTLASAKHEAAE